MEEVLTAQRESYLKEGFPSFETRIDPVERKHIGHHVHRRTPHSGHDYSGDL